MARIAVNGMEFETTPMRGRGMFSYRVRLLPDGPWVNGREPIHGRATSHTARLALAHYGKLDVVRAMQEGRA